MCGCMAGKGSGTKYVQERFPLCVCVCVCVCVFPVLWSYTHACVFGSILTFSASLWPLAPLVDFHWHPLI